MDLDKLQLLLVEDDIDLANAVIDYLALEDMTCDHAANGLSGLNLIKTNHYDVVILDLNLPKISGLEVCETLRTEGYDIPILMLTAKDTLDDKLMGFKKGADDYLVKPFAMQELIVRTQVLSSRRSGQVTKLSVCDLTLDTQQQIITRDNKALKLSPTGYKILETLMRASPNPVSRDKLIQAVWGELQPDSNSLKVHMFNLRKELDKNVNHAQQQVDQRRPLGIIHTLSGRGFAFKVEQSS
ncbi:DNA-binding response regulator [Psychromonas marina]|uniref:DNA-binding response regulator n=1 Tax=Psychromonas marina TaxID=88364 RepID=A0ABQ6E116_9GAMM|nr:response regulator transcription factor [Psychromonas marina]GLS91030.1 DNA-binding response regulator [Psychromonas marina]